MQIRTNNEGWTWSHFHRTPKMSTYLVATVVTYFDHVEYGYQADDQSNPILLRFWFSPDNFRLTEFAYDLAPKVLNFLERYLDEKFTLPKIDFISLPEVEVMAMENWGLIIHSDASLLYDPERSSLMDRALVSITVTHELAHQVRNVVQSIAIGLLYPKYFGSKAIRRRIRPQIQKLTTDGAGYLPVFKLLRPNANSDLFGLNTKLVELFKSYRLV